MPIDSKHPEYAPEMAQKTVDAYKGDVLDYVERLEAQTNEDYNKYRNRGVYYNVTKKTTEAMIGAALRKEFVTDVPDAHVSENQTLSELVSMVLRSVLLQGRCGILVDWCDNNDTPKIIAYDRGSIVNWRSDMSMIVLEEMTYQEKADDPYVLEEILQYRECFIDEETGNYMVRLWQQDGAHPGNKSKFVVIEETTPTRRGEPLKKVPFTFATPFDTTETSYNPVLLNLAQINLSHFRSTVDLEHGCHFTAIPQPWVVGEFTEDMGGAIPVGASSPWLLEVGSSTGYLEFTGAGLDKLEERLKSKEAQMASLGTQLLTLAGVESADALRMRSSALTATLNNVVGAVESAMQQTLTMYKYWLGEDSEAQFEMNRDYSAKVLSPQEMSGLMNLYLAGTISQETFLENMFEGEIAPAVEEELARLRGESVASEQEEPEIEEEQE